MAEAGVPREHISRVLNHIDAGPRATRGGTTAMRYDREKRLALEAWERALLAILDGSRVPNVITFPAR